MLRLSCSVISLDGFGDNNFVKTFDIAPKVGFKYIEFNCWHPSTLTPMKIRDLQDRCRKSGLQAASIHVSNFGGNGSMEITRDVCHKIRAMQAAKELGCRRIVASGYSRGEAGGLDAIITSLKELVPVAEDMDMLICLENHANNNIENIEDYERILAEVPSNRVGICIDTGHFDAASVDMDLLIDKFSDRVNHIHLKENKGVGTKNFTRFGEGTTDNHHIVNRMIDLGYEGYINIELSPEIGENDQRPFGIDDIIRPYLMFSIYDK